MLNLKAAQQSQLSNSESYRSVSWRKVFLALLVVDNRIGPPEEDWVARRAVNSPKVGLGNRVVEPSG